MFYELSNHFSRLLAIVEKVMINDYFSDHFSYVGHHVKSNVVYFIIYLINRQHTFIIWYLKFIIFRISNEKETQFTFSFFHLSVVSKRLVHIFYIYFINAFNYDFCVKFVHNLNFLLSTFVMHMIVTIFLIALIILSCAVDDILNSRRCISFYSKELNST